MSRDKILNTIKKNKPTFVALPEIPLFPIGNKNLMEVFIKNAGASGTTCYTSDRKLGAIILEQLPHAKNIVAPSFPSIENTTISPKTNVAELNKIDLAILESPLGVAENGAIWLSEANCIHRALPFITQHLLIILSPHAIVLNMHEAYQRIHIESVGWGVFIAGPSKTADIEQSLVIGAQGARSLSVLFH